MISSYRSYHYFLWRILAAVLPVALVYAIVTRPESIPQHESAGNDFEINVLNESDSTSAIEITVSRSIAAPSCVARAISQDTTLLGRINTPGKYVFTIPTNRVVTIIELFNPIQNVVIKSFSLPSNKRASKR